MSEDRASGSLLRLLTIGSDDISDCEGISEGWPTFTVEPSYLLNPYIYCPTISKTKVLSVSAVLACVIVAAPSIRALI